MFQQAWIIESSMSECSFFFINKVKNAGTTITRPNYSKSSNTTSKLASFMFKMLQNTSIPQWKWSTCSAMLAASAYASWIFSASLCKNMFDIPPAATMNGPVANVRSAICQQLIDHWWAMLHLLHTVVKIQLCSIHHLSVRRSYTLPLHLSLRPSFLFLT